VLRNPFVWSVFNNMFPQLPPLQVKFDAVVPAGQLDKQPLKYLLYPELQVLQAYALVHFEHPVEHAVHDAPDGRVP